MESRSSSGVLAVLLLLAIVLLQLSGTAFGKIRIPASYSSYASGRGSGCKREGAVAAGLCVENLLEDSSNVTLLNPPGCCNYCTGGICPAAPCEPCKSAVLEKFKSATLEANVGPYPLQSLTVQVDGKNVYCLAEPENLQRLTATAMLLVGPGVGCEQGRRDWRPSISGWIVDEAAAAGRRTPFDICLRWCEQDCSTACASS